MAQKQKNEGEGNRTAARAYNTASEKFAKSGRVGEQARRAQQAVDGPQKPDLDRAERLGKSKARGEDPAVSRK